MAGLDEMKIRSRVESLEMEATEVGIWRAAAAVIARAYLFAGPAGDLSSVVLRHWLATREVAQPAALCERAGSRFGKDLRDLIPATRAPETLAGMFAAAAALLAPALREVES